MFNPERNTNQSAELEDIGTWERKDFYQRLGLSDEATSDDVKEAFRRLSTVYHPDNKDASDTLKNNHTEIQKLLSEAYATLKDELRRKVYDKAQANVQQPRERPSQEQEIRSFADSIRETLVYIDKHSNYWTSINELTAEYVRRGVSKEKLLEVLEPIIITWMHEVLSSVKYKYDYEWAVHVTVDIIRDYATLGLNKELLFSLCADSLLSSLGSLIQSRIGGGRFALPDIKKAISDCESAGISKDKILERIEPIFLGHFSKLIEQQKRYSDPQIDLDINSTKEDYINMGIDRNKILKIQA